MKTKINLPAFALPVVLMAVALFSCSFGQGSVSNGKESDATVKKTVKVGPFNKIRAMQAIKIVFTEGSFNGNLQVATTPSAEKYLRVTVNDGVLDVRYDNTCQRIKGPTIIRVTAAAPKKIMLSSAASFECPGSMKTSGELDIEVTSASDVNIQSLACSKLDISATSAATVKVGELRGNLKADATSAATLKLGKVNGASIRALATSAATVKLDDCTANTMVLSATSGASVKAPQCTTNDIDITATSGGSAKASGKADNFVTNHSSGGSASWNGQSPKSPGQMRVKKVPAVKKSSSLKKLKTKIEDDSERDSDGYRIP